MSRTEDAGRRSLRLLAELVIIVVGVLIALAADRWNQARNDRLSEAAYLERFVAEIRQDSLGAAAYLESRPKMIIGLDSLIAFVEGSDPPPDLVATLISVSDELSLPPVVAWGEIQASNSLDLISDLDVRATLTSYYASRARSMLMWSRQDRRARDPLWDELYRIGIFNPKDDFGAPTSLDPEVFRSWPGIRNLLVGLGAGHYFQATEARSVLENATASLRVLDR